MFEKNIKSIVLFSSMFFLYGCSSPYNDGYEAGKTFRDKTVEKAQKTYNMSIGTKKTDASAVLYVYYSDDCIGTANLSKYNNKNFRNGDYKKEWLKGCFDGLFNK